MQPRARIPLRPHGNRITFTTASLLVHPGYGRIRTELLPVPRRRWRGSASRTRQALALDPLLRAEAHGVFARQQNARGPSLHWNRFAGRNRQDVVAWRRRPHAVSAGIGSGSPGGSARGVVARRRKPHALRDGQRTRFATLRWPAAAVAGSASRARGHGQRMSFAAWAEAGPSLPGSASRACSAMGSGSVSPRGQGQRRRCLAAQAARAASTL